METLFEKRNLQFLKNNTNQGDSGIGCIDMTLCGLFILDDFDNNKGLLDQMEQICDAHSIDKPHILGLSTNILKTNCSADDLKRDIYELETMSGCKVETSNEFAVTGCFDEKVIVCDEYR